MSTTLLLMRILKHRATWGVGIACGVLLAVWGNGALKYRLGHADGVKEEAVRSAQQAAVARTIADSTWSVLYAQARAMRDSLRAAEDAERRQAERRARAEARLEDALTRYADARAADTSRSPLQTACDVVVETCRVLRETAAVERDSLRRVITTQRTMLVRQDSLAATEPDRARTMIARGIADWRATHRSPSRVPAFLGGIVAGAVTILFGVR
jgi:hypothetical protein